jgi:hypothetical protein
MRTFRAIATTIIVIDLVLLTVLFTLVGVRYLLNGNRFDYGPDDRDEWTDDDEIAATAEYLRSTPDA